MSGIPRGYEIYKPSDNDHGFYDKNRVYLAVVDFSLITENAPAEIEYKGKRYMRGLLMPVPKQMQGRCCSMREYNE